MSETTDPQSTTPPKRQRSPRSQSARGTKKTVQTATTPPLALEVQNEQGVLTHPLTAKPPASTGPSQRPSAPKTKQQVATLFRPTTDVPKEWKEYWAAHGQPWRTEPEIDKERQKFLEERQAITPDIEQGLYPFGGIKLDRADVEWLLATHENGRGPVDWTDPSQQDREGLDLRGADLRFEKLTDLPLSSLFGGLRTQEWYSASENQREMAAIHLEGADLQGIHLEKAEMRWAHLEGTDMRWAHLEGTRLRGAHLEGKALQTDELPAPKRGEFPSGILLPANLRRASFDIYTRFDKMVIGDKKYGGISLADVHWEGVNLAVVRWTRIDLLGEEYTARHSYKEKGERKSSDQRLEEYETAVRANRQFAIVLREQGLNEDADRFAYRAQLCQRVVLRRQRKFLKYLGSWLLWLIAGYGYRPLRSLVVYLCILFAFTGFYLLNAQFVAPHLTWDQALVLSVSSFHGRGFFEQDITLGSTYARLAAAEAVVGLLIEISFIATFTQRFFSR